MNEKEKDDEVRDSVFEEILIDKEEFFLPKTPPIIPNKPTKTLPYPSRVEYEKKGENDKVQIQKFWEMFKKIHVNITLADALILMPNFQEKLEDPGRFLIPCTFSELKCKALADLGASINLMPLSVNSRDVMVPRGEIDFPGRLFECIDLTDEERMIISVRSEELKYTTRPHKESVCMIDIFSSPKEKDEDSNAIHYFEWLNKFVKDNDEINHEVFKSDNENVLGVHDNEEEEIAFLDGLLEDENFFGMNDKKVEFLESKTKEDFETKDEPKSKKELQVFHPDIEILNHFETTSFVGSDYVFYEDFNLVDMIFPMNVQGKIFDPGITFHEKPFENDAFKDKSSKEFSSS
ncbi:hypothetical protein Tco_0357044 [Tanacetum coccineum]